MAQIGSFKNTGAGYTGRIETLTLKADVTLEPIRSQSEKAPDFRAFTGITEIGIAFRRTSAKGREYITVFLDDPSFARGIWCNLLLGGKSEEFPLMWERQKAKA
jgi:uncharacterized protein (DUF736 family)